MGFNSAFKGLIVAFRSFANAPKNIGVYRCNHWRNLLEKNYKIEETKRLGPTPALFLHINCVIFKWAHKDCASAANTGELRAALLLEEGGVAPG
jgi:hypothetical protein